MMKTKKKTHCDLILQHMQTHKRGITTMDAIMKYRITRLSGRIFDLRQRGYQIESVQVNKKDKETGETVHFVQYRLVG